MVLTSARADPRERLFGAARCQVGFMGTRHQLERGAQGVDEFMNAVSSHR